MAPTWEIETNFVCSLARSSDPEMGIVLLVTGALLIGLKTSWHLAWDFRCGRLIEGVLGRKYAWVFYKGLGLVLVIIGIWNLI